MLRTSKLNYVSSLLHIYATASIPMDFIQHRYLQLLIEAILCFIDIDGFIIYFILYRTRTMM